MRVKIKAEDYDIASFEFGKRYFIAYAGCTYGDEFIYTRKKNIDLVDKKDGYKLSTTRISKKILKQLIRSGALLWIIELEENKGD